MLSIIGAGCPGKWCSHHSWRNLEETQVWSLGMWFRGGLWSAALTVELNSLKGLSQPKQFYDSVKKIQRMVNELLYTCERVVGKIHLRPYFLISFGSLPHPSKFWICLHHVYRALAWKRNCSEYTWKDLLGEVCPSCR